MMEGLYGSRASGERAWTGEPPDPVARPAWFDGVVLRRSIAYLIDGAILFIIGAALFIALSIFGLLTLGLGFHLFPLLSLVPIAYSTLLIGGPDSATWGMRMMDVQVRSWSGERPNMIQALVMTLLFYGTVMVTWFFGFLVVFFNARRRTVHDFLAGVIVVRRSAIPAAAAGGPPAA